MKWGKYTRLCMCVLAIHSIPIQDFWRLVVKIFNLCEVIFLSRQPYCPTCGYMVSLHFSLMLPTANTITSTKTQNSWFCNVRHHAYMRYHTSCSVLFGVAHVLFSNCLEAKIKMGRRFEFKFSYSPKMHNFHWARNNSSVLVLYQKSHTLYSKSLKNKPRGK